MRGLERPARAEAALGGVVLDVAEGRELVPTMAQGPAPPSGAEPIVVQGRRRPDSGSSRSSPRGAAQWVLAPPGPVGDEPA